LKNLVFILLLFFIPIIRAQNLITNSSFEDVDSCYGQPAGIGFDVFEWSGCVGWSCPTNASSDLWCPFSVGGVQPPNILGVGYQYPKTGQNYAGIATFDYVFQNYREYIQNELSAPLEANKYYQFSLFVSTNEDSINYSSCLQAYFSDLPISASNYLTFAYQPQWKNLNNNFIRDTIGWKLVSGVFKASGGEKFVTIGCFDDSINIQVLNKDPLTSAIIYYFIDDISVEEAPMEIVFPNVFTPNNDGINDLFEPIVIGIPDFEIFIYNRWGNLMATLDAKSTVWDGWKAIEGTYFYVMYSKETEITEQGFFQLVR
jgi:gliding motility-associated-like protein